MGTDCVFSGERGYYNENDESDAKDVYGKSKYLGEVDEPHCVTIRSSIIGLELQHFSSLISWYLRQTGSIHGYTGAIYSGITTMEMARVIEKILLQHPTLHGVYQVASKPINKYDLLQRLTDKLQRTDITITPQTHYHCDRSLNGDRFSSETGYVAPSWDSLLTELAKHITERGYVRNELGDLLTR